MNYLKVAFLKKFQYDKKFYLNKDNTNKKFEIIFCEK